MNDTTQNCVENALGALDCISRQAVIDTLDRMDKVLDEDRTVEMYRDLLKECYTVLPPVNPQKTQMIDKSNFDQEQYKADLQCAYDCGKASVNPQEPCSNCCNGNQIEKAKLCQKSYLAGMEHQQETPTDSVIEDIKAEINEGIENYKNKDKAVMYGFMCALYIIDKHIEGWDKE